MFEGAGKRSGLPLANPRYIRSTRSQTATQFCERVFVS